LNVSRALTIVRRLRRDEGGVAGVWFIVLAICVLLPFTFFVINLSRTHERQRQLQVQVDDGALAAASSFSGCFLAPASANANVSREAHRFSGDPSYPTNYTGGAPYDLAKFPGPYNGHTLEKAPVVSGSPLGPDESMAVGVNKLGFPPYAAPWTDFDPALDLRPDLAGNQYLPCDSDILDVKATNSNTPASFGGLLPYTSTSTKARARVEIKKVQTLSGFLPWAVPENDPNTVAAIFVDESVANGDPNSIIARYLLNKPGSNTTLNGESVALWEGDAIGLPVKPKTGMIVLVSRRTYSLADLSGSLTTICGKPQVTCYAGTNNTSGVNFIHGFPQTNNENLGGKTTLGSVTLPTTSCSPPGSPQESAPYFLIAGDCTVNLRADFDFGLPGTPPAPCSPAPNCNMQLDLAAATVKVFDGPCGNGGTSMSRTSSTWDSPPITIPDGSGRHAFCLKYHWEWTYTKLKNNGNCCDTVRVNEDGSFDDVQHVYAANTDTSTNNAQNVIEPVDYVALTGAGGAFANSLNVGSNDVHIGIGLQPPLSVAPPPPAGQPFTQPPIILRLAGKGSLTQALQCDFQKQLEDMVRDGCQTRYAVNERDGSCGPPDPTWTVSNLPPKTTTPDPIPDCIQAKTGAVTSMAKGLQERFEAKFASTGGCPPNQFAQFRTNNELPPSTDPRWVSLVVTDFGAFNDQGVKVVPVNVFAGFYVTGWFVGGGGQGTKGCAANDKPPPPLCPTWPNGTSGGCDPASQKVQGDVWGYFVTDVILGGNDASDEFCAFNEVGLCIGVLTQ
jgi:hypothetical protein